VGSYGSVLVECPVCRRERFVSSRTARRGPGRCTHCMSGDGVSEPPDDDDRRYWLERFSDEELAEMAWFMFGHRPDRAHICSERERLLGAMTISASQGGSANRHAVSAASRYTSCRRSGVFLGARQVRRSPLPPPS
jgi:hypothetical protein